MDKLVKTFAVAVVVAAGAVVVSSCGSSKNATSSSPTPKNNIPTEAMLAKNPCQELQEQKPQLRAYGEAVNFRQSWAKTYAEGQARAQYQRALNGLIRQSLTEGDAGYGQNSSNVHEGASVQDGMDKSDALVDFVSEGVVANMVVINTIDFMRQDGAYHTWVCIEYMGEIEDLANQIAKKVDQRISDDRRTRIDFHFDQYKKEMEEKLKYFNGNGK